LWRHHQRASCTCTEDHRYDVIIIPPRDFKHPSHWYYWV
jgi:hypothetical protein